MRTFGELIRAVDDLNVNSCDYLHDRMQNDDPSLLLQLPDPCLLAVMSYYADDHRSLFSAARAHSRLHQAAVLAASSIKAVLQQQLQVHSALLYLAKHSQHVTSIDFLGVKEPVVWAAVPTVTLPQLPHNNLPRLECLQLEKLPLQLQPGYGFQGVLWAGAPLKRLHLNNCMLLDGEEGLAAALPLLQKLEHLSTSSVINRTGGYKDGYSDFTLSVDASQVLQHLTYLELSECRVMKGPAGQVSLQDLTRLRDLRLDRTDFDCKAGMLPCQLTRLESGDLFFEPSVLVNMMQLQHLEISGQIYLSGFFLYGSSAKEAALLSQLQQMQQLTCLEIANVLYHTTAPAAYSALTASSKLQQLVLYYCTFPAGVWQHMFPAGRRLPHLRVLDISDVGLPDSSAVTPEGSRLASCCPGLESLLMHSMHKYSYRAELLDGLQRLSSLTRLTLSLAGDLSEGMRVVCQLTGLRDLYLRVPAEAERLLLQLTQLQHLTGLELQGPFKDMDLKSKEPGDEPVWRQLLHRLHDHNNPDVAQQAIAALAE